MTERPETIGRAETLTAKLEESEPQIKKFSWTPYALILICFFLPFLEVSCQGQQIATLTGFQTAFGTQVSSPAALGSPKVQDIPGMPGLVLILLLAAICLILPFLQIKLNHLIVAVGSGVCLFLLLLTKWSIDNESLKQGGGLVVVQVAYGYIFIFFLFIVGGLTHGFLHQSKRKKILNPAANNSEGKDLPAFLSETSPSVEFDIVGWINQNKTLLSIAAVILGSLLFIGIFFYGSFWFFFTHTPEGDAKAASANYCSCAENRNDKLISQKKEFLGSFDSFKFKTREEANQKLQKIESSAEREFTVCNNQAKAGFTELKNRYLQNKAELERFNNLFEAQKDTCSPANELKLSEISDELDEKIANLSIFESSYDTTSKSFAEKNQMPRINYNTAAEDSENTQDQTVEVNSSHACQNGQTGFFTGGNFRTSPQYSQNVQNIIAIIDPNAELKILGETTGEVRQSTGNTKWFKVRFLNGVCHFNPQQTTDTESCTIQGLSAGYVNSDLVLGCR